MSHPDPELLALAALPAETVDPEVADHLRDCRTCRAHVASLRHTVDLARTGNPEPLHDPDRPPEGTWASIAEELSLHSAEPDPVAEATPPRRQRRRLVAVGAAAAIAGLLAGVLAGIGLTDVADDASPERVVARLSPVSPLEPAADGTVSTSQRDGSTTMTVTLDGISDAGGGDYLEVWLVDRSGTGLVALGALTGDGSTFHGRFTVPASLPTERYPTVDVSAETWDGNPTHSSVSLLRGPLRGM